MIFPVPPFQQFGIMLSLGSEVHGAAEYVENTPVHLVADFPAEVGVKGLGVPASEFGHVLDSQPAEIRGDGWPDTGDAQQIHGPGGLSYLSDHTASSFPPGSVK